MINQIKVMKILFISAGIGTAFEQYKDVYATLGLNVSL